MLMSNSIEEVYMDALKRQMKKWMGSNETEKHIKEIMKVFMFNDKLSSEITKAALLMCEERAHLATKIQELVAYVHRLTKAKNISIPASWDLVVDKFRYGGWVGHGDETWIDMNDRLPVEAGLPVVVDFMGKQAKWTLLSITGENRVGLELEKVVPFQYLKKLRGRNVTGGEGGGWVPLYTKLEGRTFELTDRDIQENVMETLDRIQTDALNALEGGVTTRLDLSLEVFSTFTIPQYMLLEKKEDLSAVHLLDTLKMLHVSDI